MSKLINQESREGDIVKNGMKSKRKSDGEKEKKVQKERRLGKAKKRE